LRRASRGCVPGQEDVNSQLHQFLGEDDKALGITIPQSILVRADKVIE